MSIFVTGGTGFIGGHFLRAALTAGHAVTALRRPGSRAHVSLQSEPQWVEGQLRDDWSSTLRHCDALVHFAAVGVSPQKAGVKELFDVNVQQSLGLWWGAAEAGLKRFVICGSCFEYGQSAERYDFIPADAPLEPVTAYAASKAAATMAALALAAEKHVELIVLRPFHVFGEGQHEENFWPSLRQTAKAGKDFPMTPGEQVRDFVPAEDAAAAFVRALTRADLKPGKPIVENVGTGRPQTLRAFAEHWWREWRAAGNWRGAVSPERNYALRAESALNYENPDHRRLRIPGQQCGRQIPGARRRSLRD